MVAMYRRLAAYAVLHGLSVSGDTSNVELRFTFWKATNASCDIDVSKLPRPFAPAADTVKPALISNIYAIVNIFPQEGLPNL